VHGQRGLADARGTGHRGDHHGPGRQQRVERGELPLAPHEPGYRERQLRGYRHHGRWRCGGTRRAGQGRVLAQDRGLQVAQRLARVDAEVVGEGLAQPVVRGQRVGLPAGPVQREHELPVDLLVERLLPGQPLQVRYQLGVLAERELGVDQRPLGVQPHLVQPARLLVRQGDAGQVGQRAAAPQRERGAQVPDPLGRVGRAPALPDQSLGDLHVRALGTEVEDVAGRPGPDRVPAAQHAAQVGHVALQRVGDHRGGVRAPHRVDELVGGDDLARVQREDREHGLAAQPAYRVRHPVLHHVHRPEQPHPHLARSRRPQDRLNLSAGTSPRYRTVAHRTDRNHLAKCALTSTS
jgi:hypothetical protein